MGGGHRVIIACLCVNRVGAGGPRGATSRAASADLPRLAHHVGALSLPRSGTILDGMPSRMAGRDPIAPLCRVGFSITAMKLRDHESLSSRNIQIAVVEKSGHSNRDDQVGGRHLLGATGV